MADIPVKKEAIQNPSDPSDVTEQITKKPVESAEGPKQRQIELILPKAGNVDQVSVELLALINSHTVQLLDEQRKTNNLLEKMIEVGI